MAEAWDAIVQFFDFIVWFFQQDIYDLITDAIAYWTIKVTIWAYEWQIAIMLFFWDVAKQIMNNLNISGHINTYWGMLNTQLLGYLTALRIPEALNIIIQAIVTRFALDVWKL
jgi:hypothetical protein